jgi:hypothetical protein
MDTTTKLYVVYVKETKTRKYFVSAESEQEAEERYILEGLTSPMYTIRKLIEKYFM